MKEKTKITAPQFYLMLFLSRVTVCMTVNVQTLGSGNPMDSIVAAVLFFAANFLLFVPVFALHRRNPTASLPEIAEKRMGGFGCAVSAVYVLYFTAMNAFGLGLFLTMVLNTMDPAASKWSIALIITGIALYGAVKGIEAVSRASVCIFLLFLLGMGAIFVAVLGKVRPEYASPPLRDGVTQTTQSFLTFLGRCTPLAEYAVLRSFVAGKDRLGFTLWNGGMALFLSVLIFFLAVTLGAYADLQFFPVYTLSTMAEIAGIQRLDALFIGLCMMALVIRMACGLFSVSECLCRMLPKSKNRILVQSLSALGSVTAAIWIADAGKQAGFLFRSGWLLAVTAIFGVFIPAAVWLTDRFSGRKGWLGE